MPDYLRFRVRLLDVQADLWRRFLIKKAATFENLHMAIQDACGWQNYHLFAFRTPDNREVIAGIPDDEWGPPDPDASRVKLTSYFGARTTGQCIYEYDFGDSWIHEVSLECIEKHDEKFVRRLLDGAGAFPPEDCGSTPGYERCVAAITEKDWDEEEHGDDEERRELLVWLGDWRPDTFDLAATKRKFDI